MNKIKVKKVGAIILVLYWIVMMVIGVSCGIVVMKDALKCVVLFGVILLIMYVNSFIAMYVLTHLRQHKRVYGFFDMANLIFALGSIFNLYELFRFGLNLDIILSQTSLSGTYIGVFLFTRFSYQKLENK